MNHLDTKTKSSIDFYNEGVNLLLRGRYPDAIKLINTSLDINPILAEVPEVWYNLGLSYLKAQLHEVAIKNFNHAIEICEENMSEVRIDEDDLECPNSANKLNLEYKEILVRISISLSKSGLCEEAASYAKIVSNLNSSYAAKLEDIFPHGPTNEEKDQCYPDPIEEPDQYYIDQIEEQQGPDAVEEHRRLVEDEQYYHRHNMEEEQRYYASEGQKIYEEKMEMRDYYKMVEKQRLDLDEQRRLEKEERCYHEQSETAITLAREELIQEKDPLENHLFEQSPPDDLYFYEYEEYLNRGRTHYKQGNYAEAIKSFSKAIEIDSNIPANWYCIGWALYKMGKYVDSIQAFDRAIALDSRHFLAWHGKGIVLNELGKYDEAEGAFTEAKKLGLHN